MGCFVDDYYDRAMPQYVGNYRSMIGDNWDKYDTIFKEYDILFLVELLLKRIYFSK